MRPRAGFQIAWVLTFMMVGTAGAVAAQPPEEKPRPAAVRVVPPDEAAPTKKRTVGYTNFFDPLEMQAFSVTLLLGEIQGTSAAENVPEGAKKALADLREFLPYKSFRLLDTQWIRCCSGPNVEGRLRGLDEQYYSFGISIQNVSGQKMSAHFNLTDAMIDGAFSPGKKKMMSSSFSMETGETVVIGTSSLKGEKALVVLLTAVPRSPVSKTKKGTGK